LTGTVASASGWLVFGHHNFLENRLNYFRGDHKSHSAFILPLIRYRMVKKLERVALPVVLVMSGLIAEVVVGPIGWDELEAPSGLHHRFR
jgi:hypothetical protein